MPTPHVLIIEDDPVSEAIVRAVVRREGASVSSVGSGPDAIAYLTGRPPYHLNPFPSLVILDLDLREADGLQVLRWMAESRLLHVAPVIALSGSQDPAHEGRARALGVRRYLRMPADPRALRGEIAAVFGAPFVAGPNVSEA